MRERLTVRDADRVLSGSEGAGVPRTDALARFVRVIRDAFAGAPDPDVREAHIEAMVRTFAERPVGAPVRRWRLAPPRLSLPRLAAAMALVLAGVYSLAAAGSLGPMQDLVANTASQVGLDLPGGSDGPDKGGHDATQGEAGKQRAAANRERAEQFTTAKKEWTTCVSGLAKQHEGEDFDPEAEPPAGCGPKPHPADFADIDEVADDASRSPNPAGHVPGAGKPDDDGDVPDAANDTTGGAKGKARGLGSPAENPDPPGDQD